MEKKCLILLLLWTCISSEYSVAKVREYEKFSRSFMYTRPAYDHRSMVYSLWHDIVYKTHTRQLSGFQIIPFVNRSIKMEKTARYFLPNGKNTVHISGDSVIDKLCTRDIRAEWIGLPSNFSGAFTIEPDQQQSGCSFFYHQHLFPFFENTFLENWYVTVHVPFQAVRNDLNFVEFDVTNPGTNPRDIIEAFNQQDWHFGKLSPESKSRHSLGDAIVTVGSAILHEYFQLSYDTILSLPLGSKQDPEFLFDPVVGTNKHFGLGASLGFQFLLNDCPERFAFCFFLDLQSVLLFKNEQRRTFDLINKPWSRFLPMNKNCPGDENQNIPGVNLLTYKVEVRPYNIVDFSTGWRIKNGPFELEIGYNIWGHGDEKVELENFIPNSFGIAGTQPQATASTSTIGQQISRLDQLPIDTNGNPIIVQNDVDVNGQDVFVPITKYDIDLRSGRSASAINHKVHMSFGVIKQGRCIDGIIGTGWFVDLPQKNSSLRTWGAWLKLGAVF